jgi:SAM-dependent MidA family methyltransferase
VRTIGIGGGIEIGGSAVVFANELLDAQPFHRVVFREGRWRELGVTLEGDRLAWVELDRLTPEVERVRADLPPVAPPSYTLDLPLAAARLLEAIAARPWRGLFLTFDYGRAWAELVSGYPHGTGRAYRQHRQSSDLLDVPGSQDLTCHVCWDWLERALTAGGFASVTRQSQEAFFVHHAADAMAGLLARETDPLSRARSQLMELVHPALMGQRFEALWARRA